MKRSSRRPATPSPLIQAARTVALLLVLPRADAATYWVAPDGADSQAGTEAQPFASLRRAQMAVKPGDTVFLRGGVYHLTEADISRRDRLVATLVSLDRSGRQNHPITYAARPGERPVFDCSAVKPRGLRVNAFTVTGSWLHLKGLEVTGVQVTATGHTQSICFENSGSHNIYEQLSMHDGQAIGLYIIRGSDNLVLNCDAWRNHDHTSEGGRGGNTDGFGCHVPRGGANNLFKGCRAWFNSDDGFDCINAADSVTFIDCWSFQNGYSPDLKRLGDGNGFKAGGFGIQPGTRFPDPVPRHRVARCIAAGNPASGFYANHHPGGIDWIRNSAFHNGTNFNFLGRNSSATTDIPGTGHRILNNLSHGGKRDVSNLAPQGNQRSENTFDLAEKPSDADFQSLDITELAAPRKPDGSLPEIRFLRPVPTARIKEAGVPPTTPGHGSPAELGIFGNETSATSMKNGGIRR